MKRFLYAFSTLFLLFGLSFTFAQRPKPASIMLVLGSANLPILQHRVAVSAQFYQSRPFDRIIVSGGCGAHNSTLCEASEMKRLLMEKGVPETIILKEERSKTTVQNYVYARALEDETGQRVIQPGDTVYVVSDHWHAISVAARFNRYDHVIAYFHIEGNIQPKEMDKLDYASILYGYGDNEKFIRHALWPTADAVFRIGHTQYFIIDDLVFSKKDNGEEEVQAFNEWYPAGSQNQMAAKIDAAVSLDQGKALFLVSEDSVLRFSLKQGKALKPVKMPLNEWIKNLPAAWHRIDALCQVKDSLYVFHEDEIVVATMKGKTFSALTPVKIDERIARFPFHWASGYIDAVDYDSASHTITLYKAKEQLKCDAHLQIVEDKAKPFVLKWPTTYYGDRK